MPKTIVDDFGHRAAGRTSVLGMTRRQITLELFVRPAADAPIMIRRDVVGLPALNERSAELALVVEAEHKIARRMTIAAMAERLDEISAAVPIRRLILVRPEPMRRLEQRVPEHHQIALVERKGHVIRRWRGVHGLKAEQVGFDREHVAIREECVGRIGKRGVEMLAIVADSLMQRSQELLVGPVSNTCRRVGRDVRRIDRADHRQLERQASGKGLAARRGVAGRTIARPGEIFAAGHQIGIAEFRGGASGIGAIESRKIDLLALGEAAGIAGTKRQPSDRRDRYTERPPAARVV